MAQYTQHVVISQGVQRTNPVAGESYVPNWLSYSFENDTGVPMTEITLPNPFVSVVLYVNGFLRTQDKQYTTLPSEGKLLIKGRDAGNNWLKMDIVPNRALVSVLYQPAL